MSTAIKRWWGDSETGLSGEVVSYLEFKIFIEVEIGKPFDSRVDTTVGM